MHNNAETMRGAVAHPAVTIDVDHEEEAEENPTDKLDAPADKDEDKMEVGRAFMEKDMGEEPAFKPLGKKATPKQKEEHKADFDKR